MPEMSTAAPPGNIPTRRSGWPVLRTPRWMLAVAAVLAIGLTLFAIPRHPSTTERATIDGMINAASRSLSAGVAPPALPG